MSEEVRSKDYSKIAGWHTVVFDILWTADSAYMRERRGKEGGGGGREGGGGGREGEGGGRREGQWIGGKRGRRERKGERRGEGGRGGREKGREEGRSLQLHARRFIEHTDLFRWKSSLASVIKFS